MKKLLTATALLIACNAVHAGNSKPAAGKNAPTVDIKPAATVAVNTTPKSVFDVKPDEHNPFWPIGWIKVDNESADTTAPTIPHAEDFTVSTILLNDPPMAVINGKDMAEGEIAQLPISGQNVAVQLMAVHDGAVTLRWENQSFVVPIHRDEEISAVDAAQR